MIIDNDLKFFSGGSIAAYVSGAALTLDSDIIDLGGLPPINATGDGAHGVAGLGLDYGCAKFVVCITSSSSGAGTDLVSGGSVAVYGTDGDLTSGDFSGTKLVSVTDSIKSGSGVYEIPMSAIAHKSFRFLKVEVVSKNTAALKVNGSVVMETPHNSGCVL